MGRTSRKHIVTGLHEKSHGLRSFIGVDNRSAVDVVGLRRGTQSVSVKKPQFGEEFPDAAIREGADELTLRAEEVGSLRSFIDTNTNAWRSCSKFLED